MLEISTRPWQNTENICVKIFTKIFVYVHNCPRRPAGSCSGRLCPRIGEILTSGQARIQTHGPGNFRLFRWTGDTRPRSWILDRGTRSASPGSWLGSRNLKAPSLRCPGLSGLHTTHQICCTRGFEPGQIIIKINMPRMLPKYVYGFSLIQFSCAVLHIYNVKWNPVKSKCLILIYRSCPRSWWTEISLLVLSIACTFNKITIACEQLLLQNL